MLMYHSTLTVFLSWSRAEVTLLDLANKTAIICLEVLLNLANKTAIICLEVLLDLANKMQLSAWKCFSIP